MRKIFFSILFLLFLGACSHNEAAEDQNSPEKTADAESLVKLSNFSLQPFKSGVTYFIVSDMNWNGAEDAVFESIQLVNNDGTPISAEKGITAHFYIGDAAKKTGVYRREKIGEFTNVEGYNPEPNQTLVMKYVLSDVNKGSLKKLKINYSVDGESRSILYDWGTLSELETQ